MKREIFYSSAINHSSLLAIQVYNNLRGSSTGEWNNLAVVLCMHNKIQYICYHMKKELTVDYNIKTAWHAIYRMYNQKALKDDFTTSIGYVLLNIDSKEGTPATKIAPLIGLESRSLTRMLKNMEEKGLIVKQPDPNDRRSVRIILTELGRQKKEISRKTVLEFNNMVREIVPEHSLDIFFEVINKISKIVDEELNPTTVTTTT